MYYYRNNPKGITRRYSADLPEVQQSLLLHLDACIRTFFPNDPDVEARYLNNRITSVLIDLMRLYVFHKDNPGTRKERKKAFFSLIESEPYHTALQCFDPKTSGRWRWHLPVALMRKKQFALLDLFIGSESLYRILCAIDKRISEFENALGKDLRKAKW